MEQTAKHIILDAIALAAIHTDAGNLGRALDALRLAADALIDHQLQGVQIHGTPRAIAAALPAWWPLTLERHRAVAEILGLYHSRDHTTPTRETINRALQAWVLIGVLHVQQLHAAANDQAPPAPAAPSA